MASPSARSNSSLGSMSSVCHDDVTARIRNKLNQNKIKLWLQPYTTDSGERGDEQTQILVEQYSAELELDAETITSVIEELRVHALEKLAAKKSFQERGIATLTVKLTGSVPPQVTERIISVEINVSVSGQDLKQQISQQIGIRRDSLKLICAGKVIDDFGLLSAQGITHGSRVMSVCLKHTEAEITEEENMGSQQAKRVRDTIQGAQLLADRTESDDHYFLEIADQTGKPLDLPKSERKALKFAMTLHEKGRAAIKKQEFGEALLLLIDAQTEFEKCSADILKAVDNYALVNLDIVWCYAYLRNLSDLPDAQRKLERADLCFRQSYGPELERLVLVKGGSGTEKALFMRLHLLQGILAYHQNRRPEAQRLLERAEKELRALQVDENVITEVMSMGFTAQEARLGLRLMEGNVQMAVAHIIHKRQEKEEIRQQETEKRAKRRRAKKMGPTVDGEIINIDLFDSLVSMGYGKGAAAAALQQSNNEITLALEALNTNLELLNLPDPGEAPFRVTDEMLAQMAAMGFDGERARAALEHTKEVNQAIQELLDRGGNIPEQWLDNLRASTSSGRVSQRPRKRKHGSSHQEKIEEELERERQLIDDVVADLPTGEEDHLDLALRDEEQFLMEYKAYINSTN